MRKLSGGNVQKVLVGREISSNPKVLMVDISGPGTGYQFFLYNLPSSQ